MCQVALLPERDERRLEKYSKGTDLISLKMAKGSKLREVAWTSQAEPLRLRVMYLDGRISEGSESGKSGKQTLSRTRRRCKK